jgi:homocysteine S-methyltransferase
MFDAKARWILDGGMATELERRGFDLGHPLWSARVLSADPTAIYEVHKAYLEAGAEVLLTCSYQASSAGFQQHLAMSLPDAEALMALTVELAARARAEVPGAEQAMIGASIGPYGVTLADGSEYSGDYDLQRPEVRDYYATKIAQLVATGAVDFLAFETIPTAREAELIMETLAGVAGARAWLTFSKAEALLAVLPALEHNPQVCAVGLNCVAADVVSSTLDRVRDGTSKPIAVYPNAGGTYDAIAKRWHGAGVASWKELARTWFEQGASIVGGCCGTGVVEIRELRELGAAAGAPNSRR